MSSDEPDPVAGKVKADIQRRLTNVRFTPKSRHCAFVAICYSKRVTTASRLMS
jgi:hypothetical protein